MKTKNIGFGLEGEVGKEADKKSPFTGQVKVHGRTFTGTVIASKMQKTATVEWTRKVKIPKYERYTKKRTRVKVHNPDSIKAEEGDIVTIMECRPLSKTKHFVIVKKLGKEKGYLTKKESLEEGKTSSSAKEEVQEESAVEESAPEAEETPEQAEEPVPEEKKE